jgi:D-psicose/D-tagatose/L-ribulose 3-epimerase
MKNYSRRDFIITSSLAACSVTGVSMSCNNMAGKKRTFRYALCSEIVKEFSWAEQCRIIGDAGYDGVEIAPFTLVREGVEEITAAVRRDMVNQMKDSGIVCAGLHWLFVPPPQGLHFTTPDQSLRQRSVDYLDRLIDFCGDMGGEVMVFGSPAQRATSGGLSISEAMNYFSEGLSKVAGHANDRNVHILIESLPRSQTDVVNTLADAMTLVKKIDHPNISTMFDYHNTEDETEPLPGLIEKYIGYIRHVHVQNMDGTLIKPGLVPEGIIEILRTLKRARYDKWISTEVFDFTPGGRYIVEESMKSFLEIEKII